jgi:hypothetical protein
LKKYVDPCFLDEAWVDAHPFFVTDYNVSFPRKKYDFDQVKIFSRENEAKIQDSWQAASDRAKDFIAGKVNIPEKNAEKRGEKHKTYR